MSCCPLSWIWGQRTDWRTDRSVVVTDTAASTGFWTKIWGNPVLGSLPWPILSHILKFLNLSSIIFSCPSKSSSADTLNVSHRHSHNTSFPQLLFHKLAGHLNKICLIQWMPPASLLLFHNTHIFSDTLWCLSHPPASATKTAAWGRVC